jgi:hypothetical protein
MLILALCPIRHRMGLLFLGIMGVVLMVALRILTAILWVAVKNPRAPVSHG